MILKFQLSMPNIGSWNSKWSGSDKLYIRFKTIPKDQAKIVLDDNQDSRNYHYSWDDGWSANVTVTQSDGKEKRRLDKKSDGFHGYEWMIESIIKHQKIQTD